ncbi:hypothetical protein [Acinetobacter sp. WZC-1]|uniref:hypothetical protein n=1 Tax=Acinetobacter sp. WZC-1 TaxID=3459034 RepID=UPI00403D9A47
MKKLIWILFFLMIAGLARLSYDVYMLSQQLSSIQNILHQNEHKDAALNDQLVAMQRQLPVTAATVQPREQKESARQQRHAGISALVVIRQQLELIQFAMQQKEFVFALDQLNQLDRAVEGYELATALKQSLHQSIARDKQGIQHFMQARDEQQKKLNDILRQLDQRIGAELNNQQLSSAAGKPLHFWQKWLNIEVVDQQQPPELSRRKMVLKEVQMRLLLAQQTLAKGQYAEYQNLLDSVIQQLSQLPDTASRTFRQQLMKMKQQQILPAPKLNTTAVLG